MKMDSLHALCVYVAHIAYYKHAKIKSAKISTYKVFCELAYIILRVLVHCLVSGLHKPTSDSVVFPGLSSRVHYAALMRTTSEEQG